MKGQFEEIATFLGENDIEILPITFNHITRLLHQEFHHRDPFDRLIISQAIEDHLTIITKDSAFSEYGASISW